MNRFAEQIERLAFWYLIGEVIMFVVLIWVLYEVTKAAVKNGINESKLGKRLNREPSLYERSRKQMKPLEW